MALNRGDMFIKKWSFVSIKIEFLHYFPFDSHGFSISPHLLPFKSWDPCSPSLWHAQAQSFLTLGDGKPLLGVQFLGRPHGSRSLIPFTSTGFISISFPLVALSFVSYFPILVSSFHLHWCLPLFHYLSLVPFFCPS